MIRAIIYTLHIYNFAPLQLDIYMYVRARQIIVWFKGTVPPGDHPETAMQIEEPNLIKPFYQDYFPAIDTLIVNNAENFTHSPWNENRPINDTNYWDRKLD